MKQNLPVSTNEVEIAANVSLVSKTDLKGRITYANDAFVSVSGFALAELQGKSHNVVRHPDMPAAIFEDMWQTLKKGKPWQGLVKNRCKNGDFYWVHACVVPIRRNEQTIGYMSVRKRAEPEQIAQAQALYQQIARQGMPKVWQLPAWLGVRFGVRAGTVFVALMMLAGGVLGIGGLKLADAAFTRMYQEQFEPAIAVGQIEARLHAVRASLLEAQLQRPGIQELDAGGASSNPLRLQQLQQLQLQLQDYYDDMEAMFAKLDMAQQTSSSANAPLSAALKRYIAEGGDLINQTLWDSAGSADLSSNVLPQMLNLERRASLSAEALRHAFAHAAQQEYSKTLQRNAHIRNFAVIGIALGLLIVIAVGHLFIRGVVNPLNAAIHRLNRIAEGDLQGEIDLSSTGETAQLNNAAAVMQLHLKVMLDEIALAARSIHRHCAKLNAALYEVTEHTEAQHDQVYSAIRILNAATEETRDLSERAERLLSMVDAPDTRLASEVRDLATATRLTAFGTEEAAASMQQVGHLIVENRGEAQLAWQASEELMHTAGELNQLVDFFDPEKQLQDLQGEKN